MSGEVRGKCGDCKWMSHGDTSGDLAALGTEYYCIGSPEHYSKNKELIPKERIFTKSEEDGTLTLVFPTDDCMDQQTYGWGFTEGRNDWQANEEERLFREAML